MIRTLPRTGAGRAVSALVVAALAAGMLWFGGGQPPIFGLGGQDAIGQNQIDLSGAQPNGQEPQPYFGKTPFAPGVILIAFQSSTPAKDRLDVLRRNGLELDPNFRPNPYFIRTFVKPAARVSPASAVEDTIAILQREPAVRLAEPDYQIKPDQALPNDPNFGAQWDLHNTGQSAGTVDADIDWPEAWPLATGAPVAVAVCDDGVQFTHPDLAANIWSNPGEIAGNGIDDDANGFIDDVRGWDFASNDADPTPTAGNTHGTHVAGTVGAVTNNGQGVAGVAPNVRIMCMRMYAGQATWLSALIQSIDYARQNGAKVISVSYNIDSYTQLFVEAVQRAGDADVVYCNSAGNNSQNADTRRGQITTLADNFVLVASTTRTDTLSSFSNFGQTVRIAAPGSDITSTIPTNSYGVSSGTSMACPHMAAAVAAVRSKFPAMTAKQSLDRIFNTADIIPAISGSINGGRLNLNNALQNDSIAPSDPGKVRNSHYASHALRIQFQASGDDGLVGAAASYDLRVSTAPITAGNFASAQKVFAPITPVNAGSFVDTVIGGLAPGRAYYVAAQAIDDVGNRSAISVSPIPMSTRPLPFVENAEGTPNFTPVSGPWAITNAESYSPTKSWTDSPGSNYANNLNIELRSNQSYVVNGGRILRFSGKFDLEANHDYLFVDVSTDNGATWTSLGNYTGSSNWNSYSHSLAGFAGQTIRIRFRMTTDASIVRDGAYIDDVYIAPATVLHFDNLETNNTYSGAAPWGWVTDKSSSPTHSWTDSSAGNYANNALTTLTGNMTVNVSGYAYPCISFNAWCDLENAADNLRVLTSRNGAAYQEIGRVTGRAQAWVNYTFPMADAATAKPGFRFTSSPATVFTGVWFDDVRIIGEKWYHIRDPKPSPNE